MSKQSRGKLNSNVKRWNNKNPQDLLAATLEKAAEDDLWCSQLTQNPRTGSSGCWLLLCWRPAASQVPRPRIFFPWHPPFSTSINHCCALSRYDRIKSNLCCDRAELNVTRSSSDSIYKPRTPLPMCPAAIHMQPEKRFPSFTRHNKYHSE